MKAVINIHLELHPLSDNDDFSGQESRIMTSSAATPVPHL